MIANVLIENFKSIKKLELPLGRFNVLIGENGSGKSNVLEGLAFLAAAAGKSLDNEFLASRGVRVAEHKFMRSAFETSGAPMRFRATSDALHELAYEIRSTADQTYPKWDAKIVVTPEDQSAIFARIPVERVPSNAPDLVAAFEASGWDAAFVEVVKQAIQGFAETRVSTLLSSGLLRFLLFAPEPTALRTFEREGQILPLGVHGEGLFRLLAVLAHVSDPQAWNDLREALHVLDWFEDIEPPQKTEMGPQTVLLRDRFVPPELGYFDQRSTNEGFHFLLFYLALFVSSHTPSFFAIDNIEAALNPKLCQELIRRLVVLAKKYGKQAIVTTHNPAILDGLDLNDDEQRLFVVARGRDGDTKVRRVSAPQPLNGEPPVRLSEAFLRGLLGGLPQNF